MEPVIGLDFGTTDSAIAVAADDRQASLASFADAAIDSIFLTGGSSFVPVVRRFFSRTFGADKLRSGEELTTVAKGLALRALEN
jgi:hypothetical chaperone protein